MKKSINLLLAAVSVCCLSCCTIKKEQESESEVVISIEPPEELAGDVKIALPSTGGKREILTNVVEEYKRSRPNVNVEVEWKSSDDFYLSYQIDVSSGQVYPDAAFIDHVYIQSLASLGLIVPISSTVEDVKDLYVDNLLEASELNGKIYGYPFSANTICLYYNKNIVGNRKIPTTYQEFLEVGASIYEQEEAKPADERAQIFSLSTGADYKNFGALLFTSWLKRDNGKLLSDDLKTAYLKSNEVADVLTKWKDIVDRGWANPALSNEGQFYLGNVAFLEMGCWVNSQLFGENAVAEFGVAPVFKLSDNGKANSALGLYSLCVTKQDDENRMKLASDLCKFISTNTEAQIAYAKDSKCLPVTKLACQDEFYQAPQWKVFIDALPDAAARPGSPEWPTIQTEVGNMFMKVLLDRNTIDEATTYAQNKIQNALDTFYEDYED